MDVGKTAYGVIGVVIAVLMVATLGVPLLDDLAVVPEERSNTGYVDLYSESTAVSIVAASSAVTIDGDEFTPATTVRILVASPSFTLFHSGGSYHWTGVTVDGGNSGTLSADAWTFGVSGGTWSLNDGTNTYTGSISLMHVLDADGSKALIPSTGVAYAQSSADSFIVLATIGGAGPTSVFNEIESLSAGAQSVKIQVGSNINTIDAEWKASESDRVWALSEGVVSTPAYSLNFSVLVDLDYTAMVPDRDSTTSTLIGVTITLLVIVPVMMAVRLIGGKE